MGIDVTTYQIPRFQSVTFGTWDGSTMDFGLREPGTIRRRGMTVNTVQFPIADQHGYDVELTGRQTRLNDFNEMYKLVASGPHQMLTKTANNLWLGFTDNDTSGTFAAPVGSSLLGGNIEYIIGQTERQINYKGHCVMAQTETNWMLNSSPTTISGSGSGLPYAHPYDRGNFRRRGIAFININSADYKIFSGSRFSAVTREAEGDAGRDHRERPYPSLLKTDFQSNILCTDRASLTALNTAEQTGVAVQIGTWADEVITWNAGSCGFWVEELGQSERGFMAKIHVAAELPMIDAAVSMTPTSLTFNQAQ